MERWKKGLVVVGLAGLLAVSAADAKEKGAKLEKRPPEPPKPPIVLEWQGIAKKDDARIPTGMVIIPLPPRQDDRNQGQAYGSEKSEADVQAKGLPPLGGFYGLGPMRFLLGEVNLQFEEAPANEEGETASADKSETETDEAAAGEKPKRITGITANLYVEGGRVPEAVGKIELTVEGLQVDEDFYVPKFKGTVTLKAKESNDESAGEETFTVVGVGHINPPPAPKPELDEDQKGKTEGECIEGKELEGALEDF